MVIRSEDGKLVPLSEIEMTEHIAACPANITALCMCIAELVKESNLWLEPNKQMVLTGMAELIHLLGDMCNSGSDLDDLTDDQLSDTVVFILQAMASKRNNI